MSTQDLLRLLKAYQSGNPEAAAQIADMRTRRKEVIDTYFPRAPKKGTDLRLQWDRSKEDLKWREDSAKDYEKRKKKALDTLAKRIETEKKARLKAEAEGTKKDPYGRSSGQSSGSNSSRPVESKATEQKKSKPKTPDYQSGALGVTASKGYTGEATANIQRAEKSSGKSFDSLAPETQQAILRADAAQQKPGAEPHNSKSVFNRVIDVLSRGMYGSAEAVNANQEKFYQETGSNNLLPKNAGDAAKLAKAELKGIGAGFEGFWQGFTGKKKTAFSDTIQSVADNRKAISEGKTAAESVEGSAKVNPWLKHGVGLAADIFADPTTYMGVGLVTKPVTISRGAKAGREAAQSLEETAKAVETVTKNNSTIAPAALHDALDIINAPVEAIGKKQRKNLSPRAQQLLDKIETERVATGWTRGKVTNPRVRAKVIGSEFKPDIDLSRVAPELREPIAKAFEDELASNPGLVKTLRTARMNHFATDGPVKEGELVSGLASKNKKWIKFGRTFWTEKNADIIRKEVMKDGGHSIAPEFLKTPQDFARYIATHEIGHHAMYSMPKQEFEQFFKDALQGDELLGGYTDYVHIDEMAHRLASLEPSMGNYAKKNAREFAAEAWAQYRIMGDAASPVAKELGSAFEKYLTKGEDPLSKIKVLEEVGDQTAKVAKARVYDDLLDEVYLGRHADAVMKQSLKTGKVSVTGKMASGLSLQKELERRLVERGITPTLGDELVAQAAANMTVKTNRQVALRVGGVKVPVPGVAAAGRSFADTMMSNAKIAKAAAKWNDYFRATAHIPPALNYLRNQANGSGAHLVREYTRELQSVFDGVAKDERRAVWEAWKKGHDTVHLEGGVTYKTGAPVEDLYKYIDTEIDDAVTALLDGGFRNAEINAWLPERFKINPDKIKQTQDFVRIEDANGTAFEVLDRNPARLKEWLKRTFDDPAEALLAVQSSLMQAEAKRNLWAAAKSEFGVAKEGKLAKALEQQGWREVDLGSPSLKGQLFHPDIAHGMERLNEVFGSRRTTDNFLNGFDRANQTWKGLVTKYNPSFHIRTLLGEFMLGYIGGMKTPIRSYEKASQVLRGRNAEFLGGEGILADGAAEAIKGNKALVQRANTLTGVNPAVSRGVSDAKVVLRTRWGSMTADDLWHYYQKSGLKSGYAATDLVRGVNATVGRKQFNHVSQFVDKATENVEDFGRLAHFIDVLKHSKAKTLDQALQDATMTVSKYHLDYTAVTEFEKSWATRVMPFYKWMRLSAPVILESLLAQPGKAMVLPKALRELGKAFDYDPTANGETFPGGPDAVVPKWLIDAGAVPFGNFLGNTQYYSPRSIFPLSSVTDTTGNPDDGMWAPLRKATEIVSPVAAVPFNVGANNPQYGGGPGVRDNKAELLRYLARQTPQTNTSYNLAPTSVAEKRDPGVNRLETILQFLANPGINPNTEKRMRGEAARRTDVANKKAARAKAKAKAEQQTP